jgi:FAD/FMN-containing dehydrogenase
MAFRQPNDSPPTSPGDPLALPPGISSEKFKEYIGRATEIVGEENVTIITELEKETYADPSKAHDMFHLFDKSYFVASAVVAPRKVTEVQALMRLSNETGIPVWPFSMGRNVGYGGAAPRVPGSIGLDMGRHMNRVLEVNESGAYALVEPGVTFTGLYEHLVQKGLDQKLWIDTPDLGGGSVLGNTIERGVGYTPYGG